MKDLFINYLLETNEFYLLEACHSFELLFNFTQYGSGSEREKLRLCFIELDKNMVANYSNRIETNRNGRTLSKILTWKSDKPVVYLILAMVVSCEARSLKYIFRCLHKELKKNEQIKIRKLNDKLIDENIKLNVNSCKQCAKVFLNELNTLKFHKKDEAFYCEDCYFKFRFDNSSIAIGGFKALIDDYNAFI